MQISPSVLACDFCRLGEEVDAMEKAGADMIHLDVMDGHFVPNLSFGPPVIAMLRKHSGMLFDVHLMISDPLRYIANFAKAGADIITFHLESGSDAVETINCIRAHGKKAGISLKPDTPASAVLPLLDKLDLVLVMTVEPGFGGQKFMQDQMPKLAEIRDYAAARVLPLIVQVDGGIDVRTAPIVAAAGANNLVAGSALFGQPDYAKNIRDLRAAALSAL